MNNRQGLTFKFIVELETRNEESREVQYFYFSILFGIFLFILIIFILFLVLKINILRRGDSFTPVSSIKQKASPYSSIALE